MIELAPAGERSLALGYGGDAANVCVMAAALGARASLVGRVGADWCGERLLAFWERRGVDTGAVRRDPDAPTALYMNEARPGGSHAFTYWRRASAGSRLGPGDIDERTIAGHALLVITGVTLAISECAAAAAATALGHARRHELITACVLNHRPALAPDVDVLARTAAGCDIVIASREDAEAVFGVADLAALAARCPGVGELVLTDGERPARALVAGRRFSRPAPAATTVVNAGGAGDALAGAYLAARLRGLGPDDGLARGVAAAAASVGGAGCALSYPSGDAVERSIAAYQPVR